MVPKIHFLYIKKSAHNSTPEELNTSKGAIIIICQAKRTKSRNRSNSFLCVLIQRQNKHFSCNLQLISKGMFYFFHTHTHTQDSYDKVTFPEIPNKYKTGRRKKIRVCFSPGWEISKPNHMGELTNEWSKSLPRAPILKSVLSTLECSEPVSERGLYYQLNDWDLSSPTHSLLGGREEIPFPTPTPPHPTQTHTTCFHFFFSFHFLLISRAEALPKASQLSRCV